LRLKQSPAQQGDGFAEFTLSEAKVLLMKKYGQDLQDDENCYVLSTLVMLEERSFQ